MNQPVRRPFLPRGWRARLAATVALAALVPIGCTPEPETVLVVNSVSAVDERGAPIGELFSDVCQGSPNQCVVRPDLALVTMSVQAENPYTDLSRGGDIVVERYRVTFVRSDGRNTAGVDVPHAFDGTVNFLVPVAGGPTGQTFTIVRPQAKVEPPLVNLAGGGGSLVVTMIARIDFYGHQVTTGRAVSARGSLNVTFADFAG